MLVKNLISKLEKLGIKYQMQDVNYPFFKNIYFIINGYTYLAETSAHHKRALSVCKIIIHGGQEQKRIYYKNFKQMLQDAK